jgi:hypothetical protein
VPDGSPPELARTSAELLDELGRRLRAAETVLLGLAADMAAAGANTASERIDRAREDLEASQRLADELRRRHDAQA